jgi:putative DNA primase/helicase
VSTTAGSPALPPEILTALARMNSKQLEASAHAFASLLKVTTKDLRGAVLAAQAELCDVPFPVHVPADAPIDLAYLLSEIAALLRRYIIINDEQADAIALWVAHTHVFDTGEHCPLLIVNAPERACGKTLVQEVVSSLAHRPLSTANATPSSLFRLVESYQPTVFIDEADTFFAKNSDLHSLINSGHKRGGQVWRTESVRDSLEPKVFNVFCPKSIAGIALERHLPEATLSRGVVINMRRKLPEEQVERWRYVDRAEVDRLARGLAWIAANRFDDIASARPSLPDELGDRDQDNWQPLLAIAHCAGEDWERRATQAAKVISGKAAQPESVSHELLRDIRIVVAEYEDALQVKPHPDKSLRYISTAHLHEELTASTEFGWGVYNRGEPLTFKQLARQLAPYGVRPKTVRIRDGLTPKGYEIRLLKDAFTRYLKDEEVEDLADVTDPAAAAPKPPQLGHEPQRTDSAY